MSEQVKERDAVQDNPVSPSPDSIAWLVMEIETIPKEYLPKLLQIIRLFRESVMIKAEPVDSWTKFKQNLKNPDPVADAARQKALSELLRSWREEGDEQEQKETGDYLLQALDEDRLSRGIYLSLWMLVNGD